MRRVRWSVLVAVSVVAAVVPTADAFSDVDHDAFFAPAVQWMYEAGVTTGTSPGCFSPMDVVTRGQAAAFLHRLEGSPVPVASHPFTDVAPWIEEPVAWMVEAAITLGTTPTTFEPDRPVTRGEFATLLHRLAGSPPAPAHSFLDVVEGYQQQAISWMAAAGITTGTSATTFSPAERLTRAEVAVFLHRHRGEPAPDGVAIEPTDVICRRPLVVHAAGDVNFDPGYGPHPQQSFAYAWSGLGGLFQRDDLSIINLECVPSLSGKAVPKTHNFRCPLESLASSRQAGVDVANLANNHGGDYGIGALLDGATNVAAAGLSPVGVGGDLAAATAGARFERNGWSVIVLGFNATTHNPEWAATPARAGMASGVDPAAVAAAVRVADAQADLVFVTLHWGIEGSTSPQASDVARAVAAIDAGADAVFGHHPHRLQAIGSHRGRPIFWSLGNFVWQEQIRSRDTAVGRVIVGVDGSVTGDLIPAVIADKGHPVSLG